MLDSIDIGTSGLTAFSKELQTISNNVSNLNTIGFKGSRSEFSDFFAQGNNGQVGGEAAPVGAGLNTLSSVINFTQGQVNNTGNDLDAAINGLGFFVLHDKTGNTVYTRDGQFQFDSSGYLESTTNGDRVQGLNAQGALQDISLSSIKTNPAKATTSMTFTGGLSTGDPDHTVNNVNVIDAAGGTHSLTVDFRNNNSTTAGDWIVTVSDGTTAVATGHIQFLNGVIDPAHSTLSFTYSPSGVAPLPITLTVAPGTTSAATGTTSTLAASTVDGYAQGTITKASYDQTGHLVVTYTNGQTSQSQQLAIATFQDTSVLTPHSGNLFTSSNPTAASLGVASGNTTISADSLEASNVDLSKEFSEIIVTQRGYQASSELISTANQMLNTLIQMKGQTS